MKSLPWRTEKVLFEINNKKHSALIRIWVENDDLGLDEVIGDAENRAELEAKINRGDMDIMLIHVEASAFGFEGIDNIGGCYISSSEDVDNVLKDYCLIDSAVNDLIKTIETQYQVLTKLMKS